MVVWYILLVLFSAAILAIAFYGVCALLVDPHKNYEQDNRFYRAILNGATAVALKVVGIRIQVSGAEKLPSDTNLLFVSNHRSNFDPIITWYVFRKWPMAFVSKPENFKIPIFGRIIRRCCFMPIDRENPRNAIKTVRQSAMLMKNTPLSIGIYPEGTRSNDGKLLPFHNVVFKIAQLAEKPIAVVFIEGTENIHKNFPLRRTAIHISVLEVLSAQDAANEKTAVIGDNVRRLMLAAESGKKIWAD